MIIMETKQMILLINASICVCHNARQFVLLDPAQFDICILFWKNWKTLRFAPLPLHPTDIYSVANRSNM